MTRLSISLIATVFLAVSATILGAQQPGGIAPAAGTQPPPRLSTDVHPDLSGIWNRLDTTGAGSYTGLAATFPVAELQPEFAARLPPQQFGGVGAAPAGFAAPAYDITNQAPNPTRCAPGGGGYNAGNGGFNIDSLGMALMISNEEVLMLRDGAQGARRIRLDKGFPDASRMNGIFSIGKWEGDNLVVTTRGLGSGMVQFGRGWTEPSTELTETFTLQPGGKRMVITYTYTDPKVYVKPHVYQMTFERLPVEQYVFESWCDSKEWIDWNQQQAAGRGAAAPAGRGAAPGRGGGAAAPARGRQ
jgi:hypothetical protein